MPVAHHLPPAHATTAEEERFQKLQSRLPEVWRSLEEDPQRERTVLVLPSMSLDAAELGRLGGSIYYEERLLSFLTLLSLPRTRIIYLSSSPIPDEILSYYLQFLPGVPYSHARQRLHVFSVHDRSERSLSEKILERPAFVERIRRSIVNTPMSYMEVYRSTPLERSLAVELDLPIMGLDPKHQHLGTKSGSRKMFRKAGILHPEGFEDLRDEDDIAQAVVELHRRQPELKRVILKLNEGFAGMGNAIFPLSFLRKGEEGTLLDVRDALSRRTRVHGGGGWEHFMESYRRQGGIVEAFIEGSRRESPTVQLYLNPLQEAVIDSTHDQIMGGPDFMSYQGCRFPANPLLREPLHEAGRAVAPHLCHAGVLGPLSMDFVAVPCKGQEWKLHAVEINLRRGGTSHPLHTLRFLTGGKYDPTDGEFHLATGETRSYVATDSVAPKAARGMGPQDLIDVSTYAGLHYNSSAHRGVVFHIIGGLSQHGRVGATCIGTNPADAQGLYDQTCRTLEEEAHATDWIG